jgi:CheY-like chemotaxis protein
MTERNQRKTILVVDDDPDICASLYGIFSADGYRVITAPNGQVGLEVARAEQPDVILLDIMMPVLDGYGFLAAQRVDPTIEEIPVIVLSAGLLLEGLPRDVPRLPKPPELLALFALVESRVNGARRKRDLPMEPASKAPSAEPPSPVA